MTKRPRPISADRVEAEALDNDAVTEPTQPVGGIVPLSQPFVKHHRWYDWREDGTDDWHDAENERLTEQLHEPIARDQA